MFTLVAQGAEAKLYTGYYDGRPVIVKERFRKDYRHPTLDERLTKERLRAELRGIQRAKAVGKFQQWIKNVTLSVSLTQGKGGER